MTSNNRDKIDFAIITALSEELEAVSSKLGDYKSEFNKPLHIRHATLGRASVMMTSCGERGVKAASVATTVLERYDPTYHQPLPAKLALALVLERYDPTYLLFVGIAAGFESAKVRLGDVVVAEACYYDGPGKDTPTGKWAAHEQVLTSADLYDFSQNYHRLDWKDQIGISSPARGFQPTVHHGLIASSETVVASKAKMESLLQAHRKLRALGQEGYAVAKVAHGRKVDFLEIRGVCDFGDENKGDDWHEYAAHVAAAYAVGLLRYIEELHGQNLTGLRDLSGLKPLPPASLDLSRLPRPAMSLIGRQTELQQVQQAFLNPKIYLTILVAAGGIGKSALSEAWLKQIQPHYHGVQRVFTWSFYSQGSHNTQTSSVPFFQVALPFFGWTGEIPKDDAAKGRELAKCLQAQAFILILDGLEPLQHPTSFLDGELKDTALQAFFEEVRLYGLAAAPSLILVSSRQPLVELQAWEAERYVTIDLQTLPVADGAAVLAALGVQGTATELRQASDELGGHALALVLLGKLLKEKFAGRIERRDQLPPLWEERKQGGHALRVLQFYAERYWQPETPELAFVQLLGLFDRPMTLQEKEVLVTQADCAEPLRALDDVGWELLERHLEAAGLLNHPQPLLGKEGSHHPRPLLGKEGSDHLSKERGRLAPLLSKEGPGVVALSKEGPGVVARYHWDCHPLIRDYFGSRFQATQPDLFRQAHHVLFEYYQAVAVPTIRFFGTLEQLEPLYRAVVHGCLAGEYQKALEEVFGERIRQGEVAYSIHQLGAYSQDLTAIAAFFPHGWSQPVQQGLTETAQVFLLSEASFCLMSLGRLGEAVALREASLPIWEELQDWENVSNTFENLIALYLPMGQLAKAATVACQAIQYAEQGRGSLLAAHIHHATTLHRQGQLDLALSSFQRAEQQLIRAYNNKVIGSLNSIYEFEYCALLLDQAQLVAECEAVLGRREDRGISDSKMDNHLLSISFDHLTRARALWRLQRDAEAATAFDQAVEGIRTAGTIDLTPPFFIDRANFYLQSSHLNLETAAHDLQEADSLIRRGGMKLYAVDCQLAWCRYYLKQGKKETARECWERAKMGMEVTGYRLRAGEIRALGEQI